MDPSNSEPADSEIRSEGIDLSDQLNSPRNDSSPQPSQLNGAPKPDKDVKDYAPEKNREISTTPSASSKDPNPSPRAPSPPRWRFVNEAKKSLGYSSLAAGQVIVGKSAQELGAEYTPPTIVAESENNEEKRAIGKLKIEPEKEEVSLRKGRDVEMNSDERGSNGEVAKEIDPIEIHPSNIVVQTSKSDHGHENENVHVDEKNPLAECHSTINENDAKTIHVSSAEEEVEEVKPTFDDASKIPVDVCSSESGMVSPMKEVMATNEGETATRPNHRKKQIFIAMIFTSVVIVAVVLGVLLGEKDSESKGLDSNRADSNMEDVTLLTNSNSFNPSTHPTTNPPSYPSNDQIFHHSNMPTKTFSNGPSPKPPMDAPIPYLGNCPPPFVPLSYYTIGNIVSLNRTVFECIESSCGNFGFDPNPLNQSEGTLYLSGWRLAGACEIATPTFSPSSLPLNDPSIIPSIQPTPVVVATGPETVEPIAQSSLSPSLPPSLTPSQTTSSRPTCERTNNNINVCFAVDQSGSVCNKSNGISGFECIDCQPAFYCNSPGYDTETCCYNFQLVKDFCRDMIISLDALASDSRFSIVKFSTLASIDSELSTADETVVVLDDMIYSGGLTNHADAISVCQQSFQPADTNNGWRNFIVLITDGAPSQPEDRGEEAALEASADVKADGSYIIPILVSSTLDATTNNLFALMEAIASSDGNVLNVENFEELDSVVNILLDDITCEI
mmetsp:Transcript_15633/g.33294  ORF Transcript_15633/g.33294 Transcript_15633/m.33294 type:complete len:728 (+) Transcript_15633:224-2407(+)|eukprot:CAMPEP_0171348324 /NCGR_PEP_ID=MMETSP0878-20121228/30507_1 /TAXON_ID=67004 /ORGANISM="Thalassiosira weissflogii, Strain CCMP1336" /LENGTH=727 /DNA_ID=CAMNT_0011852631 /DNA_START=157 /DNA_END=2340 /DNA_ORIENTATION=+